MSPMLTAMPPGAGGTEAQPCGLLASRGLAEAKPRGGTFAGAALRGFWAAFS